MELTTRLYLIRHGEVEERYHRTFGGRIDMNLSERGLRQVQATADYLTGSPPEVLYASPMQRVQQTVAPLLRQTRLEQIILPGLREVDFGAWTGLSWDEVQQRFNKSAFDWLELLETGTIPDAETTTAFRERVELALDQILRESSGRTVAVYCHGGVIRMLISILCDLPFRRMNLFDVEYASLTKVVHRPRGVDIELHNFTPWRDLPGILAH